MKMFSLQIILVCLSILGPINVFTSEILILAPFASKSHKNLFSAYAEGLAKHGHKVTIVSLFPPSNHVDNITEIWYSDFEDLFLAQQQFITEWGSKKKEYSDLVFGFWKIHLELCAQFFEKAEMQEWMGAKKGFPRKTKPFNAVILDIAFNECITPVAELVADTVVVYNPATLFPWIAEDFGVPVPYSYIPLLLTKLTSEMNFWQRFKNAAIHFALMILDKVIADPIIRNFTENYAPLGKHHRQVTQSASLLLVNADPVFNAPRPSMANVIDVGGIHCRPPKQLPKEIEDFIKDSEFVIFSLGSIYNETQLTDEDKRTLISAFSVLKLKILWKFKAQIERLPTNVRLFKWLPQQDLLGHRQICAFITHSGLLSMQEAIYHSVPMVGVPLFADQPGNVLTAEKFGLTIALDWENLTVANVVNAVQKACWNENMKENVKKYSKIFKDRPQSPLDSAVFWTEYAMRHQNSTHSHVPARNMSLFQYFLIDIIIFEIFLLIGVVSFCTVGFYWLNSKRAVH